MPNHGHRAASPARRLWRVDAAALQRGLFLIGIGCTVAGQEDRHPARTLELGQNRHGHDRKGRRQEHADHAPELTPKRQGQQHHHRVDVLVLALHARLDHIAADEQDALETHQQDRGRPVAFELDQGKHRRRKAGDGTAQDRNEADDEDHKGPELGVLQTHGPHQQPGCGADHRPGHGLDPEIALDPATHAVEDTHGLGPGPAPGKQGHDLAPEAELGRQQKAQIDEHEEGAREHTRSLARRLGQIGADVELGDQLGRGGGGIDSEQLRNVEQDLVDARPEAGRHPGRLAEEIQGPVGDDGDGGEEAQHHQQQGGDTGPATRDGRAGFDAPLQPVDHDHQEDGHGQGRQYTPEPVDGGTGGHDGDQHQGVAGDSRGRKGDRGFHGHIVGVRAAGVNPALNHSRGR